MTADPSPEENFTPPTNRDCEQILGNHDCLHFFSTIVFTLPQDVGEKSGVFVEQVVFLTVDHRGPLPLRKLHSTGETWVWRDPWESWACLRPVSYYEWIRPARGCDTDDMWRNCGAGRFSYGESPRTPPHEGTSLHRRKTGVERPWGILSLFTTCLRLWVNSPCQRLWHRQISDVFVKHVVFLATNHRAELPRTPSLKGMSLHRRNKRDPLGSWGCLRPVSDYDWVHSSTGCSSWARHRARDQDTNMWRRTSIKLYIQGKRNTQFTMNVKLYSLARQNENRSWRDAETLLTPNSVMTTRERDLYTGLLM